VRLAAVLGYDMVLSTRGGYSFAAGTSMASPRSRGGGTGECREPRHLRDKLKSALIKSADDEESPDRRSTGRARHARKAVQ